MLLQNGTVALQALCLICQPCEQVSDTIGHLRSHETSVYGWLNRPLIHAASGAGKVIHLTSIDGDKMNCSFRYISFIDQGCDSVAQM